MSNFIVPNTFVPGTKAKAEDVNANFSSIQEELNNKAEKSGNQDQTFSVAQATKDYHAINKQQIEQILEETLLNIYNDFSPLYTVESGYTDENGNPEILSANDGILDFNIDDGSIYKPLVAIPANNQPKFTVTSTESIDVSSYTNGTYNVFLKSDGSAYILNNVIYNQKIQPENPEINCIFQDTSTSPITVKQYNGTTWNDFNDIYLGNITITSNKISTITQTTFSNCWATSTPSSTISTANTIKPSVIIENYAKSNNGYIKYSDGLIIQWGVVNPSYSNRAAYITYMLPFNVQPTVSFACNVPTDYGAVSYLVWRALENASNGIKRLRLLSNNTNFVPGISWIAIGY